MKLFLHRSLFRRYLITTLVVIGALYAVVLIWAWNESADVDQAEQELAMPARVLAIFSENTNAEESQKLGEQFRKLFGEFSKPAPLTDEVQYAIFRGGKLLAKSDGAPMSIFDELIVDQPVKSVARSGWFIRYAQGASKSTTADSAVLFAVRASFFKRVQRDGVIGAFTTVGLFLLVAAITAWVGSRFALTPIRELTRRILALDASRFEALTLDKPYTELNPVVTAINHRTQAIKSQVESERMFFSNAAHELRTPLAVISAQAFGVERAKTSDERAFRVQQLQSGVDRAAHSLSRMLQLARLDSIALTQDATQLKMSDIVADCVAFHAPRAFAHRQILSLTDDTGACVLASQNDLITIVDNIVENAINYAGEGATINVEIGIEKRHWIYLKVTDDGPGFTMDDHATVFERFRRGSQATHQPGTGLGLAIVKAAAQRMHGSVSAANRSDGKGLEVKVLIPEFIKV